MVLGRMGSIRRTCSATSLSPGSKIEEVFKRTRFAVRQETGGRQVPWENTSLEGDFYFVPSSTSTTSTTASSSAIGPAAAPGRERQAAPPPGSSGAAATKPTGSPSGFSFAREEEKDRATRFAKDDDIRARLPAPCAPKRCDNDQS